MFRSCFIALALTFGLAAVQGAAAEPNSAYRPYKMPSQAGAATQMLIGQGLVQGVGIANGFSVKADPKSGCKQYVGGVILEDKAKVFGNIQSNTYVNGAVANVCR